MVQKKLLQLKAMWTVPELAAELGLSRFAMGRLLDRQGVEYTLNGRKRMVSLAAFKEAFPEVWESLLIAKSMERV